MNKDMLSLLGQLGLGCVIIMALIFAACLVTPKLAAWIAKKHPEWDKASESDDGVHSAFESSKLEGFDPNYKIYHQDIYGVDFKHGKKQKDGGRHHLDG